MRFDLTEDQALLRSSARDFLARRFPLTATRPVMEHEARGYDPAAWRELAEMGYLGLLLPEAVGGQGLGAVELAIVCEEVGRVCMPGPYLDVVVAASVLVASGGHEDLVGEVAAGRRMVTIAREDALFRGQVGPGVRVADGRLQGRKVFVPFAAAADALVVAAADGLYLAHGPFAAEPLDTIDLAQRFGRVALDHAAVRLGHLALLDAADRLAAVGAAAQLLGIMEAVLATTVAYAKTRQTFGRPIGSFQALQHRMSEMLLRTESTRSAVYRASWCLDAGDPDAALACAAAKAYAGDAARLVCGEGVQMHGGIGFTWELDLHVYFKRAKTLEQHHGATTLQLERALAAAGL